MMANVRAECLLQIPAEPSPELRIPGAAAQTRVVSMAAEFGADPGNPRELGWCRPRKPSLPSHEALAQSAGYKGFSARWAGAFEVRRRGYAARARCQHPAGVLYRPWRTNVSLVFSIRRMLLESSAAAPSNETRIPQAPVAERPVALPPARRWSCKCGSRYSP